MPAVKRQLSGTVVVLALVAAGVLASACDITPPAASANGATISTATLNSQLGTLQTTAAGSCLLQLEQGQLAEVSGTGAGGAGTYTMTYANAILNIQVGDLLAEQYAASKGINLSSSDLATAQSDFASTLDGEISAAAQQAAQSGTLSFCQDATGTTITGKALLAALPTSIRAAQVRNQAVDERLLAQGADLSPAAVAAFYNDHLSQFTTACVGRIATDTQAHANQLVAQLNAGETFPSVAKANSLDTQTAANGGALGCNYTVSQVEQDLGVTSVTPGKPLAPIQDSSSGQWLIYEVTSQTVVPLAQASTVAKRELLQSTANVKRVSNEIVRFARASDVSVDPQYGTWLGLRVVPPVSPPSQFLLGAVASQTPLVKPAASGA